MKPRIKLAEAKTAQGGTVTLFEHDGAFAMSCNGQELMHSKATASEQLLGELAVANLSEVSEACVLVGGLGLGFTLRAVLETLDATARVEVAELMPEVIAWNRDHLMDLNGALLDDPRVETLAADVAKLIKKAEPGHYSAILLDIDNGPVAMVAKSNAALYSVFGLRSIWNALKPGGRAVFWSAGPDPKFEKRLSKERFRVQAVPARITANAKRAAYMLYVADKNYGVRYSGEAASPADA